MIYHGGLHNHRFGHIALSPSLRLDRCSSHRIVEYRHTKEEQESLTTLGCNMILILSMLLLAASAQRSHYRNWREKNRISIITISWTNSEFRVRSFAGFLGATIHCYLFTRLELRPKREKIIAVGTSSTVSGFHIQRKLFRECPCQPQKDDDDDDDDYEVINDNKIAIDTVRVVSIGAPRLYADTPTVIKTFNREILCLAVLRSQTWIWYWPTG